MSLDELIELHKGLQSRVPYFDRETQGMLRHAIFDFELWKSMKEQGLPLYREGHEL